MEGCPTSAIEEIDENNIEISCRKYNVCIKGKNLYIIGAGNRIQYFFSRFAPHNFILKTSAKTLKKDI